MTRPGGRGVIITGTPVAELTSGRLPAASRAG
jgi:hypothetical protein